MHLGQHQRSVSFPSLNEFLNGVPLSGDDAERGLGGSFNVGGKLAVSSLLEGLLDLMSWPWVGLGLRHLSHPFPTSSPPPPTSRVPPPLSSSRQTYPSPHLYPHPYHFFPLPLLILHTPCVSWIYAPPNAPPHPSHPKPILLETLEENSSGLCVDTVFRFLPGPKPPTANHSR
ncbi:hypothetical protein D9758_018396 [Tetrapyrgos nigripes]|uniref:Uncharacterized protein n=1 Tax=Tetrapyrgos nigripes TaxID=182062 RepID=A0A8H5BSR4_9AGAR|nr:hypothetical protein D9758_018396 [Tetrapyrgos nigripes]